MSKFQKKIIKAKVIKTIAAQPTMVQPTMVQREVEEISENSIQSNQFSEISPVDVTVDHIDRKTLEDIAGMELGNDLILYKKAFVHKSIEKLARNSTENAMDYMKSSNETLEFVGDSILGAIVADFLFRRFPKENEGFLTTARTKIVKSQTLSFFARKVGMADKILMGKQAIRTGGKKNERFLEDAFEAFVGAIYFDKGFYGAQKFVLKTIEDHFDFGKLKLNDNYKDIILRYSQSIKIELPVYNVINEKGPPHDKEFTVEVVLFGKRQGVGISKTIKKAEQLASHQAMGILNIDPKF